jgi:transcription termination/antitermination protein NusG
MLAIGGKVRIVEGPFYDFEGTIKEVRPTEGKAHLAISIFGRAETIQLDFLR